jgi:protein tyrosine/serine phosphatase
MNTCCSDYSAINFGKRFIPVEVDKKLLRGRALMSISDIRKVKNQGVTQVIDLRNSATFGSGIEKILCRIFGIKYVHCRFSHRSKTIPDTDFFEHINNIIISNKDRSYVNCQYGQHRTGLVVAAYEKQCTGKDKNEIIDNLIANGYDEIISNGKTKKQQKYINLFNQFAERYFNK